MQENNSSIFNFGFDDAGKSHLKNISQWAGICAVVAFVALGITLLEIVMMATRSSYAAGNILGTSFFQVVISLLMNILLYNASAQIRKALNAVDQTQLTRGLRTLKTYFKVYGILLIIVMVIVFFVLVFYIVSGTSRNY